MLVIPVVWSYLALIGPPGAMPTRYFERRSGRWIQVCLVQSTILNKPEVHHVTDPLCRWSCVHEWKKRRVVRPGLSPVQKCYASVGYEFGYIFIIAKFHLQPSATVLDFQPEQLCCQWSFDIIASCTENYTGRNDCFEVALLPEQQVNTLSPCPLDI